MSWRGKAEMVHHRTVESLEVMVRKQVLSFQTASSRDWRDG